MTFRKLRGDRLFDGFRYRTETVLVLDETGRVEALLPAEEGQGAQYLPGTLVPGLINCHCHLELSHMKGRIPEGTGLVDFVFQVVTGRQETEEVMAAAIEAAVTEMQESGTVAVGDICNNTLTIPEKTRGRLRYRNFVEASGWLPQGAAVRFARALEIAATYRERLPGQPTSVVPHAPYSVSPALWEALQPGFAGQVVSIHNQETAFEDAFFREGGGDFQRMYRLMNIDNSHYEAPGTTSLQHYFNRLATASTRLLVHDTFTTEADLRWLKAAPGAERTFFCLCPNANDYIERAVPPVELLRRSGCRIVLGTDSLASNRGLKLGAELGAIRKNFPHIPLEELLRWATSEGADALEMLDQLGSFEPGKRPGAVVLNEATLETRLIC